MHKNVLFPGHSHQLTTGTDDPTLSLSPTRKQGEGSSATVVSSWLRPGNRTFFDVASMVVTWWIVAFLRSVYQFGILSFVLFNDI